jgi:hypothetical protein
MSNVDLRRASRGAPLRLRRLVGLGIILTVVMGAIFVAAVRGKTIAGQGSAAPVASAPAIGDCLSDHFNDPGVDLTDFGPQLPSLAMAPCTGTRFGEVVDVEADFAAAMAAADPADSPYQRCIAEADRYLGMPPRPGTEFGFPVAPTPSDPASWTTTDVLAAFIGPDVRQFAAGQRWAACVVYLPVSILTEAPVTLEHSLRGSWLRDSDKFLFSLCVSTPTSHFGVNCGGPHRYEMIEMRWGALDVPQMAIDDECRATVVQAMGSSAAIDDGTVMPVTVPVRPNPNNDGGMVSGPNAVTPDNPYLIVCLVTATDGDRRLTAPLRGIGAGPVPLK